MKLYDVDGVHDTTTESKIVLSNDILSFYYNVTDDYVEDYLSSDNEAFVVSSVIVAGYFKRVN